MPLYLLSLGSVVVTCKPRHLSKMQNNSWLSLTKTPSSVPFGVTYEKIGTIQRRLAWPLHKDDTLSRSGRPTGLNIYFASKVCHGATRLKLRLTFFGSRSLSLMTMQHAAPL